MSSTCLGADYTSEVYGYTSALAKHARPGWRLWCNQFIGAIVGTTHVMASARQAQLMSVNCEQLITWHMHEVHKLSDTMSRLYRSRN